MKSINHYIEHTNLKPTITGEDVDKLVAEAITNQFLGVCVPPFWVKRARREVGESDLLLVTVIGFPLGYNMTEVKMEEMKLALHDGADEFDLVLNISAFKDGMMWPKIELARASKMLHEQEKILKVIVETAYLNEEEIIQACRICADAGVDFVKTSTGFAPEGAKAGDVKTMRDCLPDHVGIKASGGIKTYDQAIAMINAGADRLGTSSGINILHQSK